MEYTYPKKYKVKSLSTQTDLLSDFFPSLKKVLHVPSEISDKDSDGDFLIPHWKLIGKTYNEAVMNVMEKIKEDRPFYDWRDGKWGEQYLRQLPIKEKFWDSQEQKILTIPCQTGKLYSGKSVEQVRKDVDSHELPLGIYEVLVIVLTHPERLTDYNDLWIDCPGDEYSPDGDGSFSRAPRVGFNDGQVKTDASDLGNAHVGFGSASGFVPQMLESGNLDAVEPLTLESAIKICKDNGLKVIRTKTIEEEL